MLIFFFVLGSMRAEAFCISTLISFSASWRDRTSSIPICFMCESSRGSWLIITQRFLVLVLDVNDMPLSVGRSSNSQ